LEDYAFILDYLPQGHWDDKHYKKEAVAYGLGENEFKLLELIPKPGVALAIGDRVYIGKDLEQRGEILHVKRRVGFFDLTNAAQSELPFIIQEIVSVNMDRFIKFYNDAQAITTRFHMLELLPGLGKKTMWAIIDERKKAPFKDFTEMSERIHSLHHPEKLVAKRIELELSEPDQKYHLFVAK